MAAPPEEDETTVRLRAHAASPEKTVFTEPDNSDGWIATDYTVDVER
jgi:hypothetical protein